jgi:hypothetical protein
MWQLLSMCGHESKKIFYHEWIGFKKKKDNKRIKFLNLVYPDMKDDEIELLAKLSELSELKSMAEDLGYSKEEIAKLF